MPDRTLEDYAEGLRILARAAEYLERGRSWSDRIYWPRPAIHVLNRAMMDVGDAITAIMRDGGKDARPRS